MTRVSPNCISGNGRSHDINKLLQQYISTTSKCKLLMVMLMKDIVI